MVEAKFKEGDKVKVLDGSKIKNYVGGWSSYGGMDKYIGRVMTVKSVVNNVFTNSRIGYNLVDGEGYTFDERGLEPLEPADKHVVVIYQDGRDVVAIDKNTNKKAVATCSKDDEFDFYIGAGIAFARLKCKFEVGDKVIGNKRANVYGVTNEGWVGVVKYITECGRINVEGPSSNSEKAHVYEGLDPDRFDKYIPEEHSTLYNGKICCIERTIGLTVGKIYEVKDGFFLDDGGSKRPSCVSSKGATSFDDLKSRFCSGTFVEIVE